MCRSLHLLLLPCVLGCGSKGETDTGSAPSVGPVLEHEAPVGPFVEGDTVTLEVAASDPDGVEGVRLFYREVGEQTWLWSDMTLGASTWSASVPADDPGLEYYFRGSDQGDAVSYLPEAFSTAPFTLPVLVQALPLPFTEDFEAEGTADSVEELGWISYSQEFQGYPWYLAEGEGVDGSWGAFHARGYAGLGQEMVDWLISPPLDLTGQDRVQVTWWQTGTATDAVGRRLYVSTGSRVPDDGDFQEVESLYLESEGWSRSAVVDLSEWAGEPVVWLAWLYDGADAAWSLDSVAVEPLHADLLATLAWSPDPIRPGDTGFLTVRVANSVDVDATGVLATLVAPVGSGTLAQGTVEVGTVPADGAAEAVYTFTVDPTVPDNSYLPMGLVLDDGTRTWEQELVLTVGHPSLARVQVTLEEEALVEVKVGVGDPDAPSWEGTAFSGTAAAGASTWELDVTDLYGFLPPAAGPTRWFARITPFSAGTVDLFSVDTDAILYSADLLPGLVAGEETLVYLPDPPVPELVSAYTAPSAVAPGDTVSFAYLDLMNAGHPSAGPVEATLESLDPDVLILDPGPVVLAPEVWAEGEVLTLWSAFSFLVSPDHVDSTPVDLEVVLRDSAETFRVPLAVEVPWPVLKITALAVDDEDWGDGDGLLDPGERADLEVTVTNAGDLDASGIVHGVLEVASDSVVTASVLSGEESFGSISAGSARDEVFDLQVLDGEVGDILRLTLTLTDSDRTYTAETDLTLGELPWRALSPVDDEIGDALDVSAFDFVNGKYRLEGETLQLRLESATPVDPGTLFIEAWGSPTGASSFELYRLVIQSGRAKLDGYLDASFTDLAAPEITYPSEREVQVAWDVSVMEMTMTSFVMGYGSGWCGPPDYFCDHFPDGWGYPYEGYDSREWYEIQW